MSQTLQPYTFPRPLQQLIASYWLDIEEFCTMTHPTLEPTTNAHDAFIQCTFHSIFRDVSRSEAHWTRVATYLRIDHLLPTDPSQTKQMLVTHFVNQTVTQFFEVAPGHKPQDNAALWASADPTKSFAQFTSIQRTLFSGTFSLMPNFYDVECRTFSLFKWIPNRRSELTCTLLDERNESLFQRTRETTSHLVRSDARAYGGSPKRALEELFQEALLACRCLVVKAILKRKEWYRNDGSMGSYHLISSAPRLAYAGYERRMEILPQKFVIVREEKEPLLFGMLCVIFESAIWNEVPSDNRLFTLMNCRTVVSDRVTDLINREINRIRAAPSITIIHWSVRTGVLS